MNQRRHDTNETLLKTVSWMDFTVGQYILSNDSRVLG